MDYGDVITKGKGLDLIFYKTYGSYQGDWIIVAKNNTEYFIFKGHYGSCSCCDSLESFENYKGDEFWTEEKIKEFSDYYEPFIVVGKDDFIRLCKAGQLKTIMPANTRLGFEDDYYKDISDDCIFRDIEMSV